LSEKVKQVFKPFVSGNLLVRIAVRWEEGTVLQPRTMDNLLRVFFALPEVRSMLTAEQDPRLGLQARCLFH
jgi:hypothetical protein